MPALNIYSQKQENVKQIVKWDNINNLVFALIVMLRVNHAMVQAIKNALHVFQQSNIKNLNKI